MSELSQSNPYSPPLSPRAAIKQADQPQKVRRGPALFLAGGGLLGVIVAIPLVVAIPIFGDPNPIGYLLVLLGVPSGGVAYRLRSRTFPIDRDARTRQLRLSACTLLLPASIALLTDMRAQGFLMTIVGFVIAISFASGILLAGSRRQRSGAPTDAPESAIQKF